MKFQEKKNEKVMKFQLVLQTVKKDKNTTINYTIYQFCFICG